MNIKPPAQVEALSGRLSPLPKSRAKPRDLKPDFGLSGDVQISPTLSFRLEQITLRVEGSVRPTRSESQRLVEHLVDLSVWRRTFQRMVSASGQEFLCDSSGQAKRCPDW